MFRSREVVEDKALMVARGLRAKVTGVVASALYHLIESDLGRRLIPSRIRSKVGRAGRNSTEQTSKSSTASIKSAPRLKGLSNLLCSHGYRYLKPF